MKAHIFGVSPIPPWKPAPISAYAVRPARFTFSSVFTVEMSCLIPICTVFCSTLMSLPFILNVSLFLGFFYLAGYIKEVFLI